jgi:adenylate cyclase
VSVLEELKRRRVVKVATIYLVAAWAVIQVSDVVAPRLGLPDWFVTFIIVVAALGLPITLVLSWLFDVTPDGITRAERAPVSAQTRGIALVLLGMVISLVGYGAYWRIAPHDQNADSDFANSIAVLPFADMSPGKDQEYFGDGITEEILNTLVQLPELRVPARTSSFSFKGKNLPVSEIAKQLGVAHILEGSVRKAGERVRITAQLIDARSDKHVWSQQYDRDLKDVFAVQAEIAHAIVEALQIQFKSGQPTLLAQETASGRAHELYLKGLYYWHRRHNDEVSLALDQFRAATKEDPNYAAAWAGLALTYAILPQYHGTYDHTLAIREGKTAAARALKLDPDNAEAHAALGQIAQELEWDWPAAEQHLDEAIRLDPRNATAHQWRAELYSVLGRHDDALDEADRALAIDPLSSVIRNVRALVLWRAGRQAEALAEFKAIMTRDSAYQAARVNMIGRLLLLGRAQEAAALAANDAQRAAISGAYDATARVKAMETLANPALRAQRGNLWGFATMYMALGEPDSAAAILEIGARRWEPSFAWFAKDPSSKPLDQIPAFQRYLQLVHLDR